MPDKLPTTSESNAVQLGVIAEQIKNIVKTNDRIETSLTELKKQIDNTYATKAELAPIKAIAYGLVSLILTAVIGSILFMVLK